MPDKFSRYHFAVLGLFFLAAAPISCVSTKQTSKSTAGKATSNAMTPDAWEAQMVRVNAASDVIEDGLRARDNKDGIIAAIAEMKDAFGQVRSVKPPKGSADLFRQYIEAGAGILRDVEDHVQHSYWEKAQGSFARIKDLQKDIEKDFAPGLWSRIKLWNAR